MTGIMRLSLALLLAVAALTVATEYHGAEKGRQNLAEKRVRLDGRISFDRYYRYAEINAYLEQVAAAHSNVATLITLGKSYEGRDMNAIKLSSGSGKRMVLVDAGIHGREWVAPAMALYLLQQLTEGSATDLVNDVDWIIVPLVNPDGYEYSFDVNQIWKKTRSVFSPTEYCRGVDINRNFDFHWMEGAASQMPCDSTFAGKEAFSEPETKNLKQLILDNANQMDAYISLHSYGQYIFYPWTYSADRPDDWEDLDKLGKEINAAIEAVRGTRYLVGNYGAVLYTAGGTSDDWAKGVAKIKYTYTIKLPGGGGSGYDLPPEKIQGIVEETLEGFKVVGKRIAGK